MKMMIQADDYGITPAVADGIVACAQFGVMSQTGIFTNMPWVEYAANRIKECKNVLVGIDLNLSTGSPVTDPKLIPTLVQEDGSFLTSKMHKELDKTNPHHVTYEDAFLEYDNQVKKYIELFGHKPGYIAGHAWFSDETIKAQHDIATKYEVFDVMKESSFTLEGDLEQLWARPIIRENGVWDFSPTSQAENDPLKMFLNGELKPLTDALNKDEVFMLHTHAGFVDKELLSLSSYNVLRGMEAGFLMSDEFRAWLKENNVELVNYLDVYR